MTHKQRMLTAIAHRVPDRIPMDAIAVENQQTIADALGIPLSQVPERLDLDGRRIAAGGYRGERPREGFDEWGCTASDDYGVRHIYPFANFDSVSQIERYAYPDASQYDFEGAARRAAALSGEYAVYGPYWVPVFCRVNALVGLEETLVWMLQSPELMHAALEKVFEFVYEYCERLLDACGEHMHVLCLGDDFATQRGLMFRPELFRTFLKPRYAKLFALAKRRGLPVWFHSCGDISSVLPDLIDIGMDVWETVQLHTLPMTPRELKRQYGRDITFFGGVNTQALPFQTPEQVRAETLRVIDALGEGGGYICGPDHHIKYDISAGNALALFDACREFRREGYTL